MIKLSEVDTREDMLSCTRHYTLSIEEAQRALVEHLILNNVEGDIVELGCGTGKNTHIFADTLKKYNRSNIFPLFGTKFLVVSFTSPLVISVVSSKPEFIILSLIIFSSTFHLFEF